MRGKGFTTEMYPQSPAHFLFLGQSLTELPRESWSSSVSRVAGMMGLSHQSWLLGTFEQRNYKKFEQ